MRAHWSGRESKAWREKKGEGGVDVQTERVRCTKHVKSLRKSETRATITATTTTTRATTTAATITMLDSVARLN